MEPARSAAAGPIVVGVDGSHTAKRAAVWAAHEAASLGTGLRIISAWPMPMLVGSVAGIGGTYFDPQLLEDAAWSVVADAEATVRNEMGDRAPHAWTGTTQSNPVEALVDASSSAAMLVVGSRGRGGFASLLLGSVSSGCVHHARVPVVVIDGAAGLPGCGDVVVGVDDSKGAAAALRWAGTEAGRLGVRLTVVHGRDLQNAMAPGGEVFGELHRDEFLASANRLMVDMVDAATATLDHPPADVELRPVELTAPQALLREAKGAGLLVVGSRGRGGFAGLLLGSVSQQCVHHAPCPVAVIPQPTNSQTHGAQDWLG
jgi:nucleotide-binding universal stress UspA family protein